jgi:hypothetical protein
MNEDLAREVWSEQSMTELLGCTKKQLRRQTLENGLPAIRLQTGLYVYLTGDVRKWLLDRKSGQGVGVTDARGGCHDSP